MATLMKSKTLTDRDAALIKMLLDAKMAQHDIASLFSVNSGRISEINTGVTFGHVWPATIDTAQWEMVEKVLLWDNRIKRQLMLIMCGKLIQQRINITEVAPDPVPGLRAMLPRQSKDLGPL